MKRIIGYTRVSSKSSEQLNALEQHKARLEAAGCTEIFTDIASRSRASRKGLETVLGIIERQECDEAIFIRIDRITDSPALLERAINICLKAKVAVRGLDDSIDFTTVGGRLHARILCNLARAEVERLAERVKHGHRHHRDRNAAYFAPFAYKKVDDRLELDHAPFLCILETREEFSRMMMGRMLIDLFLEHRTLRRTLRDWNSYFGIQTFSNTGKGNRQPRGKVGFGATSLTSWLTNPILRGHIAYGRAQKQNQKHQHQWDIRYNTHPDHRLMTEEEHQQIANILDWNAKHRGYALLAKDVHPLSGLIACQQCGGRCRIISFRLRTDSSVKYHSYQCKNYVLKACTMKRSIRETQAEDQVIQALCQRATELSAIAATSGTDTLDSPEILKLRAEIDYLKAAPGNRAAAIVASLEQELRDRLAEQERQQTTESSKQSLLETFADRQYWTTLSSEERRDIYRALVNRIVIQDGEIVQIEIMV